MTIRRSNSQLCGKLLNRFFANPPLTKLPGLRLKGQRESAARLSLETGTKSQRLLTNILQEVVN